MARDGAIYVCQACGAVHGKWSGQCGACNQWNSIVEESRSAPPGAMKPATGAAAPGAAVVVFTAGFASFTAGFAGFTADAAFLTGTGALTMGALAVEALAVEAALVAGADDLAAGLDVVFFMAVMVIFRRSG